MALITRKEAAEKMGVTIHAVYMAIKQGRLTAIKDNQGKGEGLETGKGPLKVYIKPIFLNLAHQKSHISRVTHL